MMPGEVPIEIYQGDKYELFFRAREEIFDQNTKKWVPGEYLDLTGKVARGQIRITYTSTSPAAEFTCVVQDQTNPELKGAVLCSLTPAQTKALAVSAYVYDVEIETNPLDIETYIGGPVKVIPEVTRVP